MSQSTGYLSKRTELVRMNNATAPRQGKVVKTAGQGGELVGCGATLAVLEAMKRELTVEPLRAGVIAEVAVSEGEPVVERAVLVTFADAGAGDPPVSPDP